MFRNSPSWKRLVPYRIGLSRQYHFLCRDVFPNIWRQLFLLPDWRFWCWWDLAHCMPLIRNRPKNSLRRIPIVSIGVAVFTWQYARNGIYAENTCSVERKVVYRPNQYLYTIRSMKIGNRLRFCICMERKRKHSFTTNNHTTVAMLQREESEKWYLEQGGRRTVEDTCHYLYVLYRNERNVRRPLWNLWMPIIHLLKQLKASIKNDYSRIALSNTRFLLSIILG